MYVGIIIVYVGIVIVCEGIIFVSSAKIQRIVASYLNVKLIFVTVSDSSTHHSCKDLLYGFASFASPIGHLLKAQWRIRIA